MAEHASSLFNGVKAALEEGLSQFKGVPVLAISAKTGKGVDDVLKVAFELRESWSRRIPTGELNRWFEAAVEPTRRPRRTAAHQAALHHPGEDPAADLCRLRHPRRPIARKLSPLSAQRAAARPELGPVPLRLTSARRRTRYDQRHAKPNFTLSGVTPGCGHGERL